MAENQVKVRPTLTDLEVGKTVTFLRGKYVFFISD